jgi:hypothetical protein
MSIIEDDMLSVSFVNYTKVVFLDEADPWNPRALRNQAFKYSFSSRGGGNDEMVIDISSSKDGQFRLRVYWFDIVLFFE